MAHASPQPDARVLARFAAGLAPETLPPVVVARAKDLFLDYLGVTLAGAASVTAASARRAMDDLDTAGSAVVLGCLEPRRPATAALLNGTAAHCLEMDDTHHGGSIHLGATMFSAALAAAAMVPTTGATLFAAAIAGYEVAARIAMALDPRAHYERGFHPTGTCGAFGAAATAARLLGLDETRTTWALGIAGSQAAGSMEFLGDGAWTKRLHPGWAASAGLHAAALARHGVRGPERVFEGRDGFLRAHSDRPIPGHLTAGLGSEFEIVRTSVKPHACCRYIQAPIDAVLALRRSHGIRGADVEHVSVGTLEAGFPIVCEPRALKIAPRSVVDAQFSLPFGVAVALEHGRASPHEYRENVLAQAAIRALMPRITPARDPALDAGFPRRWPAWVRVRLRDGTEHLARVDQPRGDPENPLSSTDLEAKVAMLLGRARDDADLATLARTVQTLDASESIVPVLDAVRAFAVSGA
jgi:2-methylcitrate dehydratase PrpD